MTFAYAPIRCPQGLAWFRFVERRVEHYGASGPVAWEFRKPGGTDTVQVNNTAYSQRRLLFASTYGLAGYLAYVIIF